MYSRTLAMIAALLMALLVLSGCNALGQGGSNVPEPEGIPQETTSTAVFYSTGRTLVEELVVVDATNVYEATLKEMLLAQPKENAQIAIVQTQAPFKSVVINDETGLITIDWDPDVLLFDAEPEEKRLAYASIMMTMGQFPEVKRVKFTVDGREDGQIDGKDVKEFWGSVSLNGQPWDALRPPNFGKDEASGPEDALEETSAAPAEEE